MFFNKIILILCIALVLSCNQNISPLEGVSKKINNLISAQDICWKNASKTTKKYFSVKQDIKEFNAFWLCVDRSINLFANYVDGNNQNQYSYSDIKTILYKVLKQDVSAKKIFSIFSLLKDLSFFKNSNFIDKQDIAFLKFSLHEVKIALRQLLPYRKILFSLNPQAVDYADYIKATKELDASLNRIASLFVQKNSTYNKKSLDQFLKLFFTKHEAISKFVFFSKSFLTEGKNQAIVAKDWSNLFSSAAFFYSAYRGFKLYYLATESASQSFKNLQAQFKYTKFIEARFTASLKTKSYLISDIKNLILQYQDIVTDSVVVTKTTLDHIWPILNHLLEKNNYLSKGTKLNDKIFSMQHFLSLKTLSLKYLYVQNLNLNFLGLSRQFLFSKQTLVLTDKQKVFATLDLPSIKKTFNQIVRTKVGQQQMDSKGRLLFSGSYNSSFLLNNLTKLNYENLLIDLIFSVYAGADQKLTQSEINIVFNQVKVLLIDAKLLDPDSKVAETIYRESNLFMPSSQLYSYVDKQEALEYLHYIFSGLNIKRSWSHLVNKHCIFKTKGIDRIYKTSCVYNQFLKNKNNYLSFLFESKHLHFDTHPKDWFAAVSTGAGNKGQGFFLKKNLFKTGMLLQYVASIFNRFDTNKNFYLSYEESLNFFPFIKQALQSVVPITDSLELQNLYTYLLKYGKLPHYETDPLGELHIFSWSLKKNKSYEASFVQLLRVFSSMQALAI